MTSKEQNPQEARQQARKRILTMLAENGPGSWKELWHNAKRNRLHYCTFKKHMEKLVEEGIVSVEVDTKTLPARTLYVFDKDRLKLEVIYVEDVLSFIHEAPRRKTVDFVSSPASIVITESAEIAKQLFSTKEITDYNAIVEENKAILTIMSLYNQKWENLVLNGFSNRDKETILQYEDALFDYLNLHFKHGSLENLKNVKKEIVEIFKASIRPASLGEAIAKLKKLEDKPLWKGKLPEQWSQDLLEKKGKLEQFLIKNEVLYNSFKERLSNEPKFVLVLPIMGFLGLEEKRNEVLRKLPPELALLYLYQFGELSREQLQNLGKNAQLALQLPFKPKTVFACIRCSQSFKTEKECETHITKEHKVRKKSEAEHLILKLPYESYYREVQDTVQMLLQSES